jgi:FlaA1/EpsC-like NDP-sugar epimerase
MANDLLNLIGRDSELFESDVLGLESALAEVIENSKFLIIGAAGTIGKATAKEVFKRGPKTLHVVDISENNLVELVRDIRSTLGYGKGDFRSFALDCGSLEFKALLADEGPYDYVLNLSALKHVRSEKDPYTLMRLIIVNVFNTIDTLRQANEMGLHKYFCVSTDKAANPVNMMGASKRIMEMFLMRESINQSLSMARFANVAFSDGSLLHGFNQRFMGNQPFAAPTDVRRYFVTPKESGQLCLLSAIQGENRDVFFPKLSERLNLTRFSDIAVKFLEQKGYEPYICSTEGEARAKSKELINKKLWPCYFFESDTTGEKDFEEFFTEKEVLDMTKFSTIGVIKNRPSFDTKELDQFEKGIMDLRERGSWTKHQISSLFNDLLPNFNHKETGKYLDQKM